MAKRHFFKVFMPRLVPNFTIPASFNNDLLIEETKDHETIILTSPKSSTDENAYWRVKICKNSQGIWIFKGAGWDAFIREHHLKTGDFLVFQHNGNLEFNVTIFDQTYCDKEFPLPPPLSHHRQHENPPTQEGQDHHHHRRHHHHRGGDEDQKKPPTETAAARAYDYSRTLTSPHFTCTIKSSNLAQRPPYLNVPTKFAASIGLKGMWGKVTMKDPQGRSWEMNLRQKKANGVDGERMCIGRGWYEFAVGNNLKEGDVCILELDSSRIINREEGEISMILNAHIFPM